MTHSERSALLALYFGILYLEDEPRIGDAAVFATGLLDAWSDAAQQPDPVKQRLDRYVMLRDDGIASRRHFRDTATAIIRDDEVEADHGLEIVDPSKSDVIEDETRYRYAASKPLQNQIDDLWAEFLSERRISSAAVPAESSERRDLPTGELVEVIRVKGYGAEYEVPESHRMDADPIELAPASSDLVSFDIDELLSLAERIAEAEGTGAKQYLPVKLAELLASVEWSVDDSSGRVEIPAGVLQLVVARTGSGKSIFAEVLALLKAKHGHPVTLAVANIQEVVDLVCKLRSHADDLGWEDVKIAPLFSPRSAFRKTAEAVERMQGETKYEEQLDLFLHEIGYSCLLRAFNRDTDSKPDPGNEPCFRLRQEKSSSKHACPLAGACGRPALQRNALTADIVVVNHHSLLMSTCQHPVHVAGEDAPRELSVMEALLIKSGLILIDEVDAFQAVAAGMDTSDLKLYTRKRTSTLSRAANLAIEEGIGDLYRPLSFIRVIARDSVTLIQDGGIDWPSWQAMRWSGQDDAALLKNLYGIDLTDHEAPHAAYARLDRLVGGGEEMEMYEQQVHAALRPIQDWSLKTPTAEAKEHLLRLNEAMNHWNWPDSPPSPKKQSKIEGRLFLKVALGQIEVAIRNVQVRVGRLLSTGHQAGIDLFNKLERFRGPSPSPTGRLQRRSFGFTLSRVDNAVTGLSIQSFAGDPHGTVREIGRRMARGWTGSTRPVVGLSATGHFTGSPMFDCDGENWMVQPDEQEQLSFHRSPVFEDAEGRPAVRVSGLSGGERLRAMKRVGEKIARRMKRTSEKLKARDDEAAPGHQILAVTNSYAEAAAVAKGLRTSGALEQGTEPGFRVVQRDADPANEETLIHPNDIEEFASSPATVLIAPMKVVARRHNIVLPDSRSAIGAIYVLVRPVPPVGDVTSLAAFTNYDPSSPTTDLGVMEALDRIRREAESRRRRFQANATYFKRMARDVRNQRVADILVEILQLAGRARRGGTSADVYLVDGAFWEDDMSWPRVASDVLQEWTESGALGEMKRLHNSLIAGLEDLARETA